jgi:hypothetical protein
VGAEGRLKKIDADGYVLAAVDLSFSEAYTLVQSTLQGKGNVRIWDNPAGTYDVAYWPVEQHKES